MCDFVVTEDKRQFSFIHVFCDLSIVYSSRKVFLMNFSGYLCFDQYHERNDSMLEILVKYLLFAAIPTLNNKLGTNKACKIILLFCRPTTYSTGEDLPFITKLRDEQQRVSIMT